MSFFYRKTLFYLIIPAVILFFCLRKVEDILDSKVVSSGISTEYVEWNGVFGGTINADLIVQGSSRAWAHVNPGILDSAFNVNSFNLGMAAYPFDAQFCRFECYKVSNVSPKVILQCLDYNSFSKTKYLFQVNQFIPYLRDQRIHDFIKKTGEFSNVDFYFPLYKYRWIKENSSCLFNSLQYAIEMTYEKSKMDVNSEKFKGYRAQDFYWGETKIEINSDSDVRVWQDKYFEAECLNYFDSFVAYCKLHNIQLILVYPPEYHEIRKNIKDYELILDSLKGIAKKYDLPYLDYSTNNICRDTIYFYDYRHLNVKGVKLFNEILVKDLTGVVKL